MVELQDLAPGAQLGLLGAPTLVLRGQWVGQGTGRARKVLGAREALADARARPG